MAAASPTSAAKSGGGGKSSSSDSSIHVVTRVRPFNKREIEIHAEHNANRDEYERRPIQAVVAFNGGQVTFHSEAGDDVAAGSQVHDRTEQFQFNQCF